MTRRDLLLTAGLLTVGALLLANLLRPVGLAAYELPVPTGAPVSISSAGDSAWALVGNKVFYLTLRPRGDVTNRTINLIDSQDLK